MSHYDEYRQGNYEKSIRYMAYPAVLPRKVVSVLAAKLAEIEEQHAKKTSQNAQPVSRYYTIKFKDATAAQKKEFKAFKKALRAYKKAEAALDVVKHRIHSAGMFAPGSEILSQKQPKELGLIMSDAEFDAAHNARAAEHAKLRANTDAAMAELRKLVAEIAEDHIKKIKKTLPAPLVARLDHVTQVQAVGQLTAGDAPEDGVADAEIVIPDEVGAEA